jgi:protein O-GlcNAcase/histone acetyltransferase
LIASARAHDITFVYALSPGIDMVYSRKSDVQAIQAKLDQVDSSLEKWDTLQVARLGCESFALLFDDIESEMQESDKVFASFALAQVTVANAVFDFLNHPQFFFCPTGIRAMRDASLAEYCESRATPTLNESEYLHSLGKKLRPEIEILWTGLCLPLSSHPCRSACRLASHHPVAHARSERDSPAESGDLGQSARK